MYKLLLFLFKDIALNYEIIVHGRSHLITDRAISRQNHSGGVCHKTF